MLSWHDGLTRREWLRVGGLGAFGLSLPALLQGQNQTHASLAKSTSGRAKACIVLFHLGGPPQQETWDPKPDAPVEVRGEFKPIATRVPGIQVCELMPRTAQLLHHICVLRAMSTSDNAHSSSGYWMLTGTPHQPMNSENAKPGAPNDWPCTGAVVQELVRRSPREGVGGGLPPAITLPEHIWNTGGISWPGQNAGFLGRAADPWMIHCDPSQANFRIRGLALPEDVSSDRLSRRLALLDRVKQPVSNEELARYEKHTSRAFALLSSGRARQAFRIEREPTRLRERYGMNRWGQSLLLARRLVEAGVKLIQVNWTRMPGDTKDSPAWDTHRQNAPRLRKVLMPIMDQAYSTLLEDLQARGLLDETLIVWAGEFGRTPKINRHAGRDHWGAVFSVALAGGGVRGGQVLGSSDKQAAYPREGRVQPQDLTATVFHALGYAPTTHIHDILGRPLPISRGSVIRGVC